MTSNELHKEFPKTFHKLDVSDSDEVTINKT